MTTEHLKAKFPHASEDFLRANASRMYRCPHCSGAGYEVIGGARENCDQCRGTGWRQRISGAEPHAADLVVGRGAYDSRAPSGGQSTAPGQRKRIRQGRGPNKLEAEWVDSLRRGNPGLVVHAQFVRFRLANGAWYKPDAFAFNYEWADGKFPTAWEVKGGRGMKGQAKGLLALKVAATAWPQVRFVLVWKSDGLWNEQEVLP